MSKEIPILYTTPMAIAKREGRKTVTRRIMNPQPDGRGPRFWNGRFEDWHGNRIKCPWQPDDIIWGRETFAIEESKGEYRFPIFKSIDPDYPGNWRSSIFMPKGIAQIWERVVSVRPERLHDITEEDAVREGIYRVGLPDEPIGGFTYKDRWSWITAIGAYASLWESINGVGSWELNPWVFRIETEILSTTGRPENLMK